MSGAGYLGISQDAEAMVVLETTVFTRIIHYLRNQSYLHDQRQNRLRRTSVSLTRSSMSVLSVLDLASWYSIRNSVNLSN